MARNAGLITENCNSACGLDYDFTYVSRKLNIVSFHIKTISVFSLFPKRINTKHILPNICFSYFTLFHKQFTEYILVPLQFLIY